MAHMANRLKTLQDKEASISSTIACEAPSAIPARLMFLASEIGKVQADIRYLYLTVGVDYDKDEYTLAEWAMFDARLNA